MILQVGVKILFKNNDSKYLLLKRNPKKYPEVNNLWDIPGGRINPGTSLNENLKREVKEETNLELNKIPKLIAAQDILNAERHVVRLTYIADAIGNPHLSEEHSEFKWFSLEELKKLEGLDKYIKNLLDSIIL